MYIKRVQSIYFEWMNGCIAGPFPCCVNSGIWHLLLLWASVLPPKNRGQQFYPLKTGDSRFFFFCKGPGSTYLDFESHIHLCGIFFPSFFPIFLLFPSFFLFLPSFLSFNNPSKCKIYFSSQATQKQAQGWVEDKIWAWDVVYWLLLNSA